MDQKRGARSDRRRRRRERCALTAYVYTYQLVTACTVMCRWEDSFGESVEGPGTGPKREGAMKSVESTHGTTLVAAQPRPNTRHVLTTAEEAVGIEIENSEVPDE